MSFFVGIIVGVLLVPAWRLVRDVADARRADHVDVRSPERVQMLIKDSAR